MKSESFKKSLLKKRIINKIARNTSIITLVILGSYFGILGGVELGKYLGFTGGNSIMLIFFILIGLPIGMITGILLGAYVFFNKKDS